MNTFLSNLVFRISRYIFVLPIILVVWLLGVDSAKAVYPLGTEVILYHFEEEATGTTTDAITGTTTNSGSGGSAYDGLLSYNASTTSSVKLFGSRSASFNDIGDYMKTYFGSGTNPTTQSISVSLWVYKGSNTCNSGDDDHVFGVSGSPTANRFYLRCRTSTTNKWGYRVQGNAEVFSTNSVNTTGWDHLVLVANASTDQVTFYVNNTAIGSPVAYTTYTLPGHLYVGNYNDTVASDVSQGAGGFIDEVAIYNTAITATDVNTLYQAGIPAGVISGLTATAYDQKVYLNWTAGSGTTTDYTIEYKLSADSTWTTFDDGVSTATNTTVTNLTNGSLYDFRITPKNGEVIGTVSSTVSATPWYRIQFISPTPSHGSGTTSSLFTVYASTTPSTPSTTTATIRLETSAGSLVSQVSTTTRYGDRNLTHLTNIVSGRDLALNNNSSGVAYVPTTGTLFLVHNNTTGLDSTIDEIDTDGVIIRTITCTACGDIEGITLISSVASSTAGGYDHTFMLSSENDTANAEIYRVVIHSTGSDSVNKTDYFDTGITHGGNLGLEGISYNSSTGVFYVVREKSTPAIFEITLGAGHSATSNQICTNLDFSSIATDFSDIFYNNSVIYILSHENDRLIPVNITSTTSCAFVDSDGDGSSATTIDTGDYLNTIPVGATTQPEGVTWDTTGDYLYVIGEADYLAKYRTNAYTTRHTFSGLSEGNYVIYSSFLDTNGVTTNASSSALTIDASGPSVSMTSPTDSSYVQGSSVTVSASASDTTSSIAGIQFKLDTNTLIGSEDTSAPYSISWNSSEAIDGTHTIIAVARDSLGNYSTSTAINITIDNTAPSRSSGAPTGTLVYTTTSTTLSLTTNETATCKYSTDSGTAYGSMTDFDTTSGTSHSTSVSGLTSNTSYTYYVKCQDTRSNTNASDYSISFSVATDDEVPIISSISSGTPDTSSATITWTTNENSSTYVSYGLTSALGTNTTETDTSPRVTNHSKSLTNLVACTTYYYKVRSKDSELNTTLSSVNTFTTLGCTGSSGIEDSIAEEVTIASGGTVDLVTDNKGPTLTIPSGFSDIDADFQIKKLDSGTVVMSTGLPTGLSLASDHIYDFKAYSDPSTSVASFDQPIEVVISYSDSEIGSLDESTLTIKRWNGSSWNSLSSCSVNTTTNTVTCTTTAFSVFGLFGSTSSAGSNNNNQSSSSSSSGGSRISYTEMIRLGILKPLTDIAVNITGGPFNKPLYFGIRDPQVRILQKILNTDLATQVASSGAGSNGNETTIFLNKTKIALQTFQMKYNIVKSIRDPGYGRVGPATRQKLNEIYKSSNLK
jgi:uncharacterized protein YjiK